jgi:hypothetical protein
VADVQTEFPEHEEIVEELGKLGGQKTEERSQKTE